MYPMNVKRPFLLFIILIAAAMPLYCAEEKPVRTYLPAMASQHGMLPVDDVIGRIAEPDCDDAHVALSSALGEEYSFEWTQNHIAEPVRAALVRLFDSWFSTHLPCSGILMSVSHANADGSIGINVRAGGSCVAFVMSEGMIVSMKEIAF